MSAFGCKHDLQPRAFLRRNRRPSLASRILPIHALAPLLKLDLTGRWSRLLPNADIRFVSTRAFVADLGVRLAVILIAAVDTGGSLFE